MKKPTLKELQGQLAEAQATIAGLSQKLELATAEVSGLRASTAEHERTARTATERLQLAQRAMAPFATKTTKWEWPNDAIMAVAPLTFGDLRSAKDAALALRG